MVGEDEIPFLCPEIKMNCENQNPANFYLFGLKKLNILKYFLLEIFNVNLANYQGHCE